MNDSLRYLLERSDGAAASRSTATPGSAHGTWIFWRFLAEYFGGAIPANGHRSRDVEPCRRVAGGPDRYSTQAAAQAIAARTVNGTPWKLRGVRRLRRLEQPAGEVLRRGRVVWPGAGRAEQDPHEGHAVVRLEHDARPPSRTVRSRSIAVRTYRPPPGSRSSWTVLYGTGPEASLLVIRRRSLERAFGDPEQQRESAVGRLRFVDRASS